MGDGLPRGTCPAFHQPRARLDQRRLREYCGIHRGPFRAQCAVAADPVDPSIGQRGRGIVRPDGAFPRSPSRTVPAAHHRLAQAAPRTRGPDVRKRWRGLQPRAAGRAQVAGRRDSNARTRAASASHLLAALALARLQTSPTLRVRRRPDPQEARHAFGRQVSWQTACPGKCRPSPPPARDARAPAAKSAPRISGSSDPAR